MTLISSIGMPYESAELSGEGEHLRYPGVLPPDTSGAAPVTVLVVRRPAWLAWLLLALVVGWLIGRRT